MILYDIIIQKAQVRIRSTNQILTSFMILMTRPDLRSMIHDDPWLKRTVPSLNIRNLSLPSKTWPKLASCLHLGLETLSPAGCWTPTK